MSLPLNSWLMHARGRSCLCIDPTTYGLCYTDYVFDGEHAPYKPYDATNALNTYGKLKQLGEEVVKKYPKSGALCVPVLYGEVLLMLPVF